MDSEQCMLILHSFSFSPSFIPFNLTVTLMRCCVVYYLFPSILYSVLYYLFLFSLIILYMQSLRCIFLGAFMTNVSRIAAKVSPYIISSNVKIVYISTDTCSMVQELRKEAYFGGLGVTILTPCDRSPPTRGDPQATLRLLAEIEMMKNGLYFFGLMRSNLCSMVYLLRHHGQQQSKNTINLIACKDCRERLDVFNDKNDDALPRRLFLRQ